MDSARNPTTKRRKTLATKTPKPTKALAKQLSSSRPARGGRSTVSKEIYKYQHTTDLLFRKLPFARLVREIINRVKPAALPGFIEEDIQYRLTTDALEALQTVAEDFLVTLFTQSQMCATHGNRVTLMNRDMVLVLRIRKLDM